MSTRSIQEAEPGVDGKLRRDLRTLAKFIDVYCRRWHANSAKAAVRLKTFEVDALYGRPLRLCASCRMLLAHAFVKRALCPLDPKPACQKCPTHCYTPQYRSRIREVMKYSGRRLILRGRLQYLFHLLG